MTNRHKISILHRVFLFVTAPACIASCGGTETFLRSQPATHIPSGSAITVDSSIKDFLKIHCLQSSSIKYTDTGSTGAECLYISADVSALAGATLTPELRLSVVDTLLSISDLNCSTFLHRAFANRAGLDYTKTLLQDLATAASAGTAFVSAPVSAGLSGTNLVLGKGIDTFNSTYYQQQTFQAMESAIDSARQIVLATINTHESAKKEGTTESSFTTAQALADIRDYDDACSFKNGLAKLNEIATNAKTNATTVKNKVQAEADPNSKAQILSGGQTSQK
jgi:uncharacterized protein YfcZ (UPF0381/DUF406 family)